MKVKQDLGGQNSLVTPRLRRILPSYSSKCCCVSWKGKTAKDKTDYQSLAKNIISYQPLSRAGGLCLHSVLEYYGKAKHFTMLVFIVAIVVSHARRR